MKEDLVANAASRYRAFVSYSHADARFAAWLHRKLEASRLPDGTRLAPIFIDRAELAAGPDLSAQVREALSDSAALVVIASPAARASRWVGQEIELFRQLHPGRPILAALIAGEPDEAFPDPLLRRNGAALEPLAADFREGQDGKRLGLLKIAAGLSAQPLDRLVQRDAQSRQRRVMAVTAGAVILSLVLSALLVVALRARAEAERQRAEAEGLVEFMLTDLRNKLKGVGRLDVMDAVNQRVMARYSSNPQSEFPDEILLRRARLFQGMAEDDLSSVRRFKHGVAEAEAAAKITADLMSRNPKNGYYQLTHAKSEYWLGEANFRSGQGTAAQRAERAKPHWSRYRDLTRDLAERPGADIEWIVEASYAEGNLCAIELAQPVNAAKALQHCVSATKRLESALLRKPGDIEISLNLASAYAWQADAHFAAGNRQESVRVRETQVSFVTTLAHRNPNDMRLVEARMLASIGLGKLFLDLKRTDLARKVLNEAASAAKKLQAHDPANQDWKAWLTQISKLRRIYKK